MCQPFAAWVQVVDNFIFILLHKLIDSQSNINIIHDLLVGLVTICLHIVSDSLQYLPLLVESFTIPRHLLPVEADTLFELLFGNNPQNLLDVRSYILGDGIQLLGVPGDLHRDCAASLALPPALLPEQVHVLGLEFGHIVDNRVVEVLHDGLLVTVVFGERRELLRSQEEVLVQTLTSVQKAGYLAEPGTILHIRVGH